MSGNLPEGYEVPKVWTWDGANGGAFASVNRPTAGAQREDGGGVAPEPARRHVR